MSLASPKIIRVKKMKKYLVAKDILEDAYSITSKIYTELNAYIAPGNMAMKRLSRPLSTRGGNRALLK